MVKTFSTLLIFMVNLLTYGQFSKNDINLLSKELAIHVNELRNSQGLAPLLFNDTLKKAAQNQSDYMSRIDKITHDQKKILLSTPAYRVQKYNGIDFELVGENVLHSDEQKFPLNKRELKQLAESMFLQWKNSPGHYANMINPAYQYGDFGFAIGKKRSVVFATQVFGRRGSKIEGQISPNAFGIKEYIGDCDTEFDSYSNIVANMGNSLRIEGNKVVLYFHNYSYFDKIFPGPKDGIAVDLVSKEQFKCGESNRLDVSIVHDGILLEPIYRDKLLSENRAQNIHRLITTIGVIPENLPFENYVASIVLIRDGKKCKYLVPAYVPSKKYELRPIEPILINPEQSFLRFSGIIKSQEFIYNFNRSKSSPISFQKIIKQPYRAHSIYITSHTSVEGDSVKNKDLHKARAQNIKKHILKEVKINDSLINIVASENWSNMLFQFKYLFADSLIALPRDSIKSLIDNHKNLLPWDSLLFEQRKSFATINYFGELADTASIFQIAELNLRTAIAIQDFDLANKALFEIYNTDIEDPSIFFEGFIFEALKNEQLLVQNAAAIYSRIYGVNLFKTTTFINKWIVTEDAISPEAINNILHLYTLIGKELLRIWDLPSERLSNVIHPARVNKFFNQDISSELALNIHLTAIQYFGQINDGPNISKSFNYIVDYFKKNDLTLQDEVDLCLFFNSWSRYDLTNKMLMKRFQSGNYNEDGIFILAQTLNFYGKKTNNSDYKIIHEKAVVLNQQRWCNWLSQDFQMLRNNDVKELFCNTCN